MRASLKANPFCDLHSGTTCWCKPGATRVCREENGRRRSRDIESKLEHARVPCGRVRACRFVRGRQTDAQMGVGCSLCSRARCARDFALPSQPLWLRLRCAAALALCSLEARILADFQRLLRSQPRCGAVLATSLRPRSLRSRFYVLATSLCPPLAVLATSPWPRLRCAAVLATGILATAMLAEGIGPSVLAGG